MYVELIASLSLHYGLLHNRDTWLWIFSVWFQCIFVNWETQNLISCSEYWIHCTLYNIFTVALLWSPISFLYSENINRCIDCGADRCTVYKSGRYIDLVFFQVDHWLEFTVNSLENASDVNKALQCLNKSLAPVAFLVGHSVTLADFAVWGALKGLW